MVNGLNIVMKDFMPVMINFVLIRYFKSKSKMMRNHLLKISAKNSRLLQFHWGYFPSELGETFYFGPAIQTTVKSW